MMQVQPFDVSVGCQSYEYPRGDFGEEESMVPIKCIGVIGVMPQYLRLSKV